MYFILTVRQAVRQSAGKRERAKVSDVSKATGIQAVVEAEKQPD